MATHRVFDDVERVDPARASHGESHAQFLNRVHTPYWQAVRDLIEGWFANLPDDAKPDIRARLRSPDNRQFHAAFWELYLHEALTRAGYRVTSHPEIPGTTRRPDFLVEGERGTFYLEAKVAAEADDQIAAERRRNRVYDALDRLRSPNFFLWVDVEGEGSSDLATTNLRKQLERWLARLDPDEISDRLLQTKSILSVPCFEWRCDDWHLVFRPWPKKPESRGSNDVRPLGVFGPGEAYTIDDVEPLRKALVDKGSAYGDPDRPYVIAIRTSSLSTKEFDIVNALYGTLRVQFALGPTGEIATREVRAPDGYWFGGREWKHRQVSAVLIARNLQPWMVTREVPTLWEHPDPARPVTVPPMWRRAIVRNGGFEYLEPEVAPHEVFGLPAEWPEGDPFEPDPEAGDGDPFAFVGAGSNPAVRARDLDDRLAEGFGR